MLKRLPEKSSSSIVQLFAVPLCSARFRSLLVPIVLDGWTGAFYLALLVLLSVLSGSRLWLVTERCAQTTAALLSLKTFGVRCAKVAKFR